MTFNSFIFDFDGVMIDSEPAWDIEKAKILRELFGPEASAQVELKRGLNMDAFFDHALQQLGTPELRHKKTEYLELFHRAGDRVYQEAALSAGLEELIQFLGKNGYKLGIVSASPMRWITAAINRLNLERMFQEIVSLEDRRDLAHKPAPDGYRYAMEKLGTTAECTIILEDSNAGIASGKASGAYTIGLTQNLSEGQILTGADSYAKTLHDLIDMTTRMRIGNR